MLVQPDEEEKEAEADADLLADPLEYQDEDAFEDRVAAADFDDTRPVGGLTVGAGRGLSFSSLSPSPLFLCGCRRGLTFSSLSTSPLFLCVFCLLTRICVSPHLTAAQRDLRRGSL